MKRSGCSSCFDQSCVSGGRVEEEYCPMNIHPEVFDRAKEIYANNPESAKIARSASMIEAKGYIAWPRLRDIIGLCESMGATRLALLFCPDLWKEAKKTKSILSEQGFTVLSRVCRVGADDEAVRREELQAFAEECGGLGQDLTVNAGLCVEAEFVLSNPSSTVAKKKIQPNQQVTRIKRGRGTTKCIS